MRSRTRGIGLLETIVAVSIFSVLLASLFYFYYLGANAWMKSDTDSELLGQAQTFSSQITRAAERSSFLSLTVHHPTPTAVSFLSPVDSDGRFHFDPYTKRPKWQKYLIYYRDSETGEVKVAERSVTGTQAETIPLKLPSQELQDDLSSYFTAGKVLLSTSKSLRFRIHPLQPADRRDRNERLEIVLTLAKDVRGQTDARTLELRSFVKFRN